MTKILSYVNLVIFIHICFIIFFALVHVITYYLFILAPLAQIMLYKNCINIFIMFLVFTVNFTLGSILNNNVYMNSNCLMQDQNHTILKSLL